MSSNSGRQAAPTAPALLHYIIAIDLAALVTMVAVPAHGLQGHVLEIAVLAVLAAAVAARPVRIPALYTEVTPPDAFVFCAIASSGPLAAAFVSAVGVLGAALGRPRFPAIPRLLFNLGSVTIASCLAWASFALAGGRSEAPLIDLLLPLAAATTTFFILNTALVAIAIALERRESMFSTWRRSGWWTAVSSFTGMTLAFVLLLLLKSYGVSGLLLGVPPCWMLGQFYLSHKDRLEQQQMRIDAVQQLNTQLEGMVTERTGALEQAMTRVEQSNCELRQINERLQELSRVKSEFLAKVSHELRTPLNAVLGFAELLQDPSFGALDEQQRDFVRDIRSSGEGLLGLINDILDLSRIEAGKMDPHRQEIDLENALREITSMMAPLVRDKHLTLTSNVSPNVGGAFLDAGMLREVVTNLLSNAIKFTDAGGRIELRAHLHGQDIEIAVRDTGIGIPVEHRDNVFQEFFQVDNSYARRYEGTGLGLALVRRMVALHGGTVTLESKVGSGSLFSCTFPGAACTRPRAVRSEPIEALPAKGRSRSVLVVEDNRLNRKLVRNALRARGHSVFEAETGEAALELAARIDLDIVLMDIELKGLDGLEVTRRLKEDPATTHLPVLALSAHAHCEHEQKALAAGCVGYLRKPIRLSQLPIEIERHCIDAREVTRAS